MPASSARGLGWDRRVSVGSWGGAGIGGCAESVSMPHCPQDVARISYGRRVGSDIYTEEAVVRTETRGIRNELDYEATQ